MRIFFTILSLLSFIGLSKISAQTVTDIDGNIYNTVTIGTQVWMKENLKTTKYRDGSAIPNVTDGTIWHTLSTGAYGDYNNTPSNSDTYGRLYNWYAVVDAHNICPINWHVPSDAEWNILGKFLDNTVDTTATGYVGTDIGGKLKEIGTTHWTYPNTGATNSSGFGALPGGLRDDYGEYFYKNGSGNWWSTTAVAAANVFERRLSYTSSKMLRLTNWETLGFSVRCVSDLTTDIKGINYNEQIKIYPNPANDNLVIETNNNSTIEIINTQGQLIKTINTSNTKTTIDISKLSGGVYTLKVKTDKKTFVKKLVKE